VSENRARYPIVVMCRVLDVSPSVPIAEFLASRTSWTLTSELSYKHLSGPNVLPDFWCDFAGRRKVGKDIQFILEAKFLKGEAKIVSGRIAFDFIRLSLPPRERLKRYFLLAGESKFFPKSDADFCLAGTFLDCNLLMEDATSNQARKFERRI
jgi:hypothetical protein